MKCPVCLQPMKFSFSAVVLGKYPARYEVCESCGFLAASEPYWLDEAYSRAIAAADTGLVARNLAIAAKVAGALYWAMSERGDGLYLDAAGGYGLLARLLRDAGFDFYWSDKYCDNLFVPGFEYAPERGSCRVVTAMEVMEHLADPITFVEETLASCNAQTLLFSTVLYQGAPPPPDQWWYYTFETGQHIGFFQRRTLEVLGAKLGLRFCTANGLHVLSRQPVDESLLGWATGRWATRFSMWWVRRQLGSKTLSDHQMMLKNMADQ